MRDPSDSGSKPAAPNPTPGAPVAASGRAFGVAARPQRRQPNRPGSFSRNPVGQRSPTGNIPDDFAISPPSVSLPKGGGALQGIGEKFQANPATGTASFSIPLPATPARGKAPEVSLAYNSGAGNGPFGIGWTLSVASIRRKTDRGLPRYIDSGDSADTFVMSGAEDLVPMLNKDEGWAAMTRTWNDGTDDWTVSRYRPRVDDAFAVIERFRNNANGETFWRTLTRDNVQRVYGRTSDARVADPDKPTRVFEWLLEEESDELGNVTAYVYEQDFASPSDIGNHIADAGRKLAGNTPVYVHLKRVSYGNTVPYASPERTASALPPRTTVGGWTYPTGKTATSGAFRFHLVFDYGEHNSATPELTPAGSWSTRLDPFSSFRSRFDIRCQRLCQRVLLFHDFASVRDDADGDGTGNSVPAVVRSVEFTYDENEVATRMTRVVQKGWTWVPSGSAGAGSYTTASLPALDFGYSEATIDETVRFVDGLNDIPNGLDTSRWQWVDLDGEGLSGLLTERAGGWFYKRNEGSGGLGATQRLGSRPNVSLGAPGTRLVDLGGDGKLDVVVMRPDMAGYHERTTDGGWESFRHFKTRPTESVDDPNTRLVDLDGDGIADMLITEGNVFRWYPSKAKEGYDRSRRTFQPRDEKKGPHVVFAGSGESIQLADMTGDGLSDIVRIRNGNVCYWPNKGYGQFGARVQMKSAPRFDSRDRFDPARVRLADIDGTGTTDLVYIGPKGIQLCFNQSGNGFSAIQTLSRFPAVSNAESVQVADLRGDGTACLVWASPLMRDAWQPLRYVHLMSEGKPYLLTSITNNRGRETRLTYAPSTQFYLADRQAGTPWATRLAFPVQCLQKVEQLDHITGWRFTSVYAYHHGYFDGPEREFRGFGLVDQWDTESFSDFEDPDKADPQIEFARPPVRVRTWFHTGAWKDGGTLLEAYVDEYYKDDEYWVTVDGEQVYTGTLEAPSVQDGPGVPTAKARELREAHRALKGRMLRQETYAEDGSADEAHPYTVTEQNFRVVRLQAAQGDEGHAVFRVDPQETLSYQYDRNPADPRVSHQLTLEVDDYGTVTRSAALSYPRRSGSWTETEFGALHMVVTEASVINDDHNLGYDNGTATADPDNEVWHLGLPVTSQTWELTSTETDLAFTDTNRATASALLIALDGDGGSVSPAQDLGFEEAPTTGTQRRILGHQLTLYWNDALNAALGKGAVGFRALPFRRHMKAYTDDLLTHLLDNGTVTVRWGTEVDAQDLEDAGYLQLDDNGSPSASGDFWIGSGQLSHNADAFYLPVEATDPFNSILDSARDGTTLTWDTDGLVLTQVVDPLGNTVQSTPDYRTLTPEQVTDPNGVIQEVATDPLGRVTATAIRKPDGAGSYEGDDLDHPTVQITYADDRYSSSGLPNRVVTVARTTHYDDGANPTSATLTTTAYTDGSGNIVQEKVPAAPGEAHYVDSSGVLQTQANANPRYIGTGRVIVDNKGNVVKRYEPFFSTTDEFEDEDELVEWGVSPRFHYDPIGRNIQVDIPIAAATSGTDPYEYATKTFVYSPWAVQAFDELDNWNDAGNPHYDTPTVTALDPLGRVFLTTQSPDGTAEYDTRVVLDVQGNPLSVVDPRGNTIQVQRFDMAGRPVFTGAADEGYDPANPTTDKGHNVVLLDVQGQPLTTWRSGDLRVRLEVDALRRPVARYAKEGTASERLVEYRVYGESIDATEAKAGNLLGQAYAIYDTAGRVRQQQFSIQGALLESSRTLLDDLATDVDFAALRTAVEALTTTTIANVDGVNPSTVLSTATGNTFDQSTTHDALGRVLTQTTPDNSITRHSYDAGSRLVTVDVDIWDPATSTHTLTSFVSNIEYNARGQRTLVAWREETDAGPPTEDRPIMTTALTYDDHRFWLTRLVTERDSVSGNTAATMQDLTYSRDRVGNITGITDDAQDTLYFNNTTVTADQTFEYDGLYRLTAATGREKDSLGQPGATYSGGTGSIPQAAGSMRQYRQEYDYDEAGNIIQMVHSAGPGTGGTTFWRRVYAYEDKNNQLIANSKPGESVTKTRAELQADPSSVDLTELNDTYAYNDRGAMTFLPHLDTSGSTNVTRDFRDQIRELAVGTSAGTAHYAYDGGAIRVAKLWDKSGAAELRVYIGSYEVFRSASSVSGLSSPSTELHTLHVMDGERRVAMVETYTAGAPTGVTGNRIRMQLGNHLGTACIETDKDGGLLTYEEFHPYGTTAWWAEKSSLEVSAKRYRYTGMERDEESGLQYHNARYYMPWLGRWERADPIGTRDGANRFSYCGGKPTSMLDTSGRSADSPKFAAQSHSHGNYGVTIGVDGGIDVAEGDSLSQYSGAIHGGDLSRVDDFYRLTPAGFERVDDTDLIYAGERVYYGPAIAEAPMTAEGIRQQLNLTDDGRTVLEALDLSNTQVSTANFSTRGVRVEVYDPVGSIAAGTSSPGSFVGLTGLPTKRKATLDPTIQLTTPQVVYRNGPPQLPGLTDYPGRTTRKDGDPLPPKAPGEGEIILHSGLSNIQAASTVWHEYTDHVILAIPKILPHDTESARSFNSTLARLQGLNPEENRAFDRTTALGGGVTELWEPYPIDDIFGRPRTPLPLR